MYTIIWPPPHLYDTWEHLKQPQPQQEGIQKFPEGQKLNGCILIVRLDTLSSKKKTLNKSDPALGGKKNSHFQGGLFSPAIPNVFPPEEETFHPMKFMALSPSSKIRKWNITRRQVNVISLRSCHLKETHSSFTGVIEKGPGHKQTLQHTGPMSNSLTH